jgi:hypothetical protein
VHWRVPAAALRPLVPAPLAIDTFDGDAFVGIVPFTMRGVRPRWSPAVPACRASTRPTCAPTSTATAAIRTAAPGTLEHFLVERYLLYAQRHDGGLRRGQVHHPPYPLQDAELSDWDESLLAAAGIARPAGAPLVHFAAGVDVEVFGLI